jgi:hypothetical protein
MEMPRRVVNTGVFGKSGLEWLVTALRADNHAMFKTLALRQ